MTVHQEDGDGRAPTAYLPELTISGLEQPVKPVVQVIREAAGKTLYTLRVAGASVRPGVFEEGAYTVRIGNGERWLKTLTGVEALYPPAGVQRVRSAFLTSRRRACADEERRARITKWSGSCAGCARRARQALGATAA